MKLLEIAHSRTGDKGDISNISVIAYDMKDYEFIKEKVTVELVAKVFAGYCRGTVTRYDRRAEFRPDQNPGWRCDPQPAAGYPREVPLLLFAGCGTG